MEAGLPTFGDIESSQRRLRGRAVTTPLVYSPEVERRIGVRTLLKVETMQRTGTFKFRGACAFISRIPEAERGAGVVAYSSGNHAQGVAAAARLFGIPATIVMPDDAPSVKLDRTKALGAEVVTYDRRRESREEIGEALAGERGAILIPPYDHPGTIAGQGTVGLEIARQCEAEGEAPDAVLVPCGGGGLTAGIALALERLVPAARVWTVEPAGFDDHARSFREGRRLANDPTPPPSMCDALLAPTPGEITFQITRRLVAGGLVVADDEVRSAMRFAFEHLKLVLEPGGAVALAALLSGRLPIASGIVVAVLSGGNVAPGLFAEVIAD